jgi:hypothetical protein
MASSPSSVRGGTRRIDSPGPVCQTSFVPARTLITHTGFLNRRVRLRFVHTLRTPASESPATRAEHQPPGGIHRFPGPSGSSEVARHAGVLPTSPCWCRVFRSVWRVLGAWVAQTAGAQGPTGSSGRQRQPGVGVRGMSTAAGPGGSAVRGGTWGASPPILPPREPVPAVTTHSAPGQRRVDARHCVRLPALIASLSSPDRETGRRGRPGCHTGRDTSALIISPAQGTDIPTQRR